MKTAGIIAIALASAAFGAATTGWAIRSPTDESLGPEPC